MKLAHIFKDSIIEESSNLQESSLEISPELKSRIEYIFKDTDFKPKIHKDQEDEVILQLLYKGNPSQVIYVRIEKNKYDIDKRWMNPYNISYRTEDFPSKISSAIMIIQKELSNYRIHRPPKAHLVWKSTKDTATKKMDEGKEEENKLVSLTRSIESEMDKVDDSLSYEDFAFVVASILKNGYGSSVTTMFMKELANQLKK